MKIGIVCDCHNTLVYSNDAWIQAFVDFIGEEKRKEIEYCLYSKSKRRNLAFKYNLDFSCIEDKVTRYSQKNDSLIEMLNEFKNLGFPLFVVSNAPYYRVKNDLEMVNVAQIFDEIFSEEDGGKKNSQLFDHILNKYKLDFLIFIGNEEFDDYIEHPKVLSLVLASYLLKRFDVLKKFQ